MKLPAPRPEAAASEDTIVSDATLRQFVGYNLKRAFNVYQTGLVRALKPLDLRMLTYTALVLIVDNPGVRQSQLAEAMDVERPNLVVILDELERRDLILRERVPTDRRAYALLPTLAGRRLYDDATRAVQANEDTILAGISKENRAGIIDAMRIILKSGR